MATDPDQPSPSYGAPALGEPAPSATLVSGESAERGRAARRVVPRSAHGEWSPAPDRPDPIALLQAQAETRLQDLVPIRYGRMSVSPFTFYRGAAAVMAADLSATLDSGITVQACGDAHISNFGGFAAQDRRLVFGPNDFDETLPGPWEWDVKRMAASVEIAARDIGLPADRCRVLVADCVREYREAMWQFAEKSHLNVWYERLNASELVDRFGGQLGRKGRILLATPFAKAQRKTSLRAVEKLTERDQGQLRFRSVPPLLVPLHELVDPNDARRDIDIAAAALEQYAKSLDDDRRYLFATYRFVDMARKVVGVGSVGTRAWVLLFVARGGRDPLVLQMKEAQASVLEPYLGASEFENHGERVVRGRTGSHRRRSMSFSAGSAASASMARSMTSTSVSSGTGRRRLTSRRCPTRVCTPTRGPAGGHWPAPTLGRVIDLQSPRISVPDHPSIGRSSASPPHTPTRTSSITSDSPTPSRRAR